MSEKNLYEAKIFTVESLPGFKAAGTICGHVDFVVPRRGTYTMTPSEVSSLITMLRSAHDDVLNNADPNDPRLYDPV
jgi:hypothetical protein